MNTICDQSNFIKYVERASTAGAPCLTLVMSTPSGGRDYCLHVNRAEMLLSAVLKNELWIERFGFKLGEVVGVACELIGDSIAWSGTYESICIHASADYGNMMQLADRKEDRLTVGDRFLFKDTQQQLDASFDGVALRLSLKEPKAYRISNRRIVEYEALELPESIYSLSEAKVVDGGNNAHVRTSSSSEGSPEMTGHGMSSKESVKEMNMEAFVREIVGALEPLEDIKTRPLILIGEDKVVSLFSTKFERLFSGGVYRATSASGHPNESEILEISQSVGYERYQKEEDEVLEAFREIDPQSPRYSDNLKEVYEGSEQGRVAVCAISQEARVWAVYDQMSAKLTSSKTEGNSGAEQFEILDTILTNVIKSDGRCVVLPESKMPSGKDVAAIYKW